MSTRGEELAERVAAIQGEIAAYSPTLIAVTKTYPVSDVAILRDLGLTNFGENRSGEGLAKSAEVSGQWHYQGEIQSKKIREILSWAQWIHSLDDLRHCEKIERALVESGGEVKAFLQLSLDGDPRRGGLIEEELFTVAAVVSQYSRLSLQGIMCVPPVSMEPGEAFQEISATHLRFKSEFPDSPYLSAGMSGDYMVALEHGATHIRVGSKILGARSYDQ